METVQSGQEHVRLHIGEGALQRLMIPYKSIPHRGTDPVHTMTRMPIPNRGLKPNQVTWTMIYFHRLTSEAFVLVAFIIVLNIALDGYLSC